MPSAARLSDTSTHGGAVLGPGVPTVLVGGMPAAVLGDLHLCPLPPSVAHPPSSPFILGSATVLLGGRPALRAGDVCACGASVAVGLPTVQIGG